MRLFDRHRRLATPDSPILHGNLVGHRVFRLAQNPVPNLVETCLAGSSGEEAHLENHDDLRDVLVRRATSHDRTVGFDSDGSGAVTPIADAVNVGQGAGGRFARFHRDISNSDGIATVDSLDDHQLLNHRPAGDGDAVDLTVDQGLPGHRSQNGRHPVLPVVEQVVDELTGFQPSVTRIKGFSQHRNDPDVDNPTDEPAVACQLLGRLGSDSGRAGDRVPDGRLSERDDSGHEPDQSDDEHVNEIFHLLFPSSVFVVTAYRWCRSGHQDSA